MLYFICFILGATISLFLYALILCSARAKKMMKREEKNGE